MAPLHVVLAVLLAQPLPHEFVEPHIRPPAGVYPQDTVISAREADLVHEEADRVSHDVRKVFGRRYAIWRAQWSGPIAPFGTPEYLKLESMGRAIMPLLIEKLLDESEAPAMVLYDHVVPLEFFVQGEAAAPDSPVLRLRALATIRRFLRLWPMQVWLRKD